MIDLRSDTVTKPTEAMLQAMYHAKVGDDVFKEDEAVNELQEYAAQLLGMEAALFCPSGTMTNQIAIKVHTQPGGEVICSQLSHIYQYEGGGIAANSGCSVALLPGDRGMITAQAVEAAIQPDDVHKPITQLVSLENTSNRGGGACYQLAEMQAIAKVCKKHLLPLHLDGARLANAWIANNEKPQQYGEIFTSVSLCLSKGLGAPVGSLLLGSKTFINKATRWRKVFGGGMRQAGSLAAAGLYALRNNVERLATDHQHAKLLGQTWLQHSFVQQVLPVETNIVVVNFDEAVDAKKIVQQLANNKILCFALTPHSVRMVTHLNLQANDIDAVIQNIQKLSI
ncbi:MAG: aminotransferase class I/II-fold pyridoxal phosphate-dependent enzyme [Bacteroidetes bacterium]|nr:MAG: aminotransferase class I/II-fold pyridoxal phosphate-dependent enzyme [Bacteroidota bacterium]TAF93295.1 MAG: aminotransferase class I/II-fold pyridoxal phosphate-dependent enzyme [Bacteroidota bacterium]